LLHRNVQGDGENQSRFFDQKLEKLKRLLGAKGPGFFKRIGLLINN